MSICLLVRLGAALCAARGGWQEEKSKQITRCSFHFNCVRIDFDRNLMFTILLLLDTLTNEFQRNENHIPIPLCRLIVSCFLSFIFFIFHYAVVPVRFFSCYFTVIHSRVVNSFNIETGILLDTLCVWHKSHSTFIETVLWRIFLLLVIDLAIHIYGIEIWRVYWIWWR